MHPYPLCYISMSYTNVGAVVGRENYYFNSYAVAPMTTKTSTTRFTQKVTISEEALSQEVNGETVILDLKSESYFGLDEVGTRIWQLLQEHGDIQKSFDIMLEEYDVEEEQLENDMTELVEKLEEAGLVIPT